MHTVLYELENVMYKNFRTTGTTSQMQNAYLNAIYNAHS